MNVRFFWLGMALFITGFFIWWMIDSAEYDRTVNDDPGVIYQSAA